MDVTLVCMPWAKIAEPSLGLGILHASLERSGRAVRSRYFNALLLKYLKQETYEGIADLLGLNEFMFTGILDDDLSVAQTQSLLLHAHAAKTGDTSMNGRFNNIAQYIDLFMTIRREVVPEFVDECVELILQDQPRLVGFTCLFDQTMPSLAVAKRLRQRAPEIMIAFGGYALHGPPGKQLLGAHPFVDAVAIGDGEETIVELAAAAVEGRTDLNQISGLLIRTNGRVEETSERPRLRLDQSPFPEFKDYFAELENMHSANGVAIPTNVIPLETSRGCWWGQKSHCTFCGIDDDTMKYRSKSDDYVLDMLKRASQVYPGRVIRLVDYILPYTYFRGLLARIASEIPSLRISCEAKSNMDLSKFEMLRAAGFIAIQPGIESFSTPVLKRMRKGVSGIQNVRTLKLGKRTGIRIDWNILYGFPGDEITDYDGLKRSLPSLYHLDPPFNHSPVFLTRFSPMHKDATRNGMVVRQHPMYDVWFSDYYVQHTGFDVSEFCYIFDPKWEYNDDLEAQFGVINAQIRYWKNVNANGEADVLHSKHLDGVLLQDTRAGIRGKVERYYPGRVRDILAFCDTSIRPLKELQEFAGATTSVRLIDQLIEDRILYREDDSVISLSTEVGLQISVGEKMRAKSMV